ncbi:thiol-disulfide oxidoreductase DCC family protein [Brevibacillus sp. H7]|jgi:predicted DCC family thiol-disulfide oxidoreductase YuxK|uniref:thiol-disulfide oxidoreductase DCC family protein n=1 Tax=Brevibacillus sp. H7 TaxID=3349138 RepID=UPI00381483D7
MKQPITQGTILLFDGECNLCSGTVQFILPRDRSGSIRFASLQSSIGKRLLAHYHYPSDEISSVVLIDNGRLYTKSAAVLRVTRKLRGIWPLLYAFILIPAPLRNTLYDWVARNRYQWFGKREHCLLPRPDWKDRFLE